MLHNGSKGLRWTPLQNESAVVLEDQENGVGVEEPRFHVGEEDSCQ